MLRPHLLLHAKEPQFSQVSSILTQLFIVPSKHHLSTQASLENPQTLPHPETNQTHKELYALNFSAIAKNVISKCSRLSNTDEDENFSNLSLNDYLLRLSSTSPETTRRFWRVSLLNPQNVLDILRCCESESENYEIGVEKVESLWGIFKWASGQTREFAHLPHSCKIMASVLVRAGMFREVEHLLSRRESQEILLDCEEIFSNLIKGYVGEFELDKAFSVYERMRGLSLVPCMSSYRLFLKYLMELNETKLMYQIYLDMMKTGMEWSEEDKEIHEKVVRLLCVDGNVQEARDLVKKVMSFRIEPSNVVINALTWGYCEKKDYDDLLSFLTEIRISPDTVVGNTILFSLSRNFGVEQASMFLPKLEDLSFCPDEITSGILIGSSCREGKLKDAFVYVSEIMSRGLKPHVYSYNAILSGMFKDGFWMHSRDVLVEMKDMGVTPQLSTFRVLLAGFCKGRKFEEVKAVIAQMEKLELVKLSPCEDPLTKAFTLLGLDPSSVKIKRDNDKGFFKTEFYDNLGNGLYLDADVDEFEEKIHKVLYDAMIPDFNTTLENCLSLDIKSTFTDVDEMVKWGQKLSLPVLSSLLSRLSGARCSINVINRLLEVTFESPYHLDDKTLSMLVETYSRKGLTFRARTLLDGMVRGGRVIYNNAYSALLVVLCKKQNLKAFVYCYKLAKMSNWSPELKDSKTLFDYLFKNKWLNEALLLLETIMDRINIDDIICGFCREKRFGEASVILDNLLANRVAPPVNLSILLIHKLCRSNNFEKAVMLKDLCLNEQLAAVVPINCALIVGFCNSEWIGKAATLFKKMILDGLLPDPGTFNALIQGYCRAKKLTNVEELLGVIVRRNISIPISSFSNIARLTCRQGKCFLALNLKELMTQVTKLPELVLYNILIFHFFSTQNSSQVNAVIDDLLKKKLQPDAITYDFTVQGFLQCNNVSHALHYLTSMISQDFRPSNRSLREAISYLCYNGEIDKALNLSQEMESRGWIHGSVIQCKLVELLLNTGKLSEAVHFLDRMEVKGLIPKNVDYNYLIKQLCVHSRLDKAVHLLNIMLRNGSIPDSTSYDFLIQGYCSCNNLDRAMDFYREMMCRELKPCVETWKILVWGLCESGRVGEAEKVLDFMLASGEMPSREMFCAVIDRYRAENNSGKASELLNAMQEKGYEPDFGTHWSVISKLTDSSKKDGSKQKHSFLSGLLSGFGIARKNPNSKAE